MENFSLIPFSTSINIDIEAISTKFEKVTYFFVFSVKKHDGQNAVEFRCHTFFLLNI